MGGVSCKLGSNSFSKYFLSHVLILFLLRSTLVKTEPKHP